MLFSIFILLVVLGTLIIFHELGHFVAAKICGVYCDRFSLGMPPRIFGIKIGETDYCLGLLPIGGYVKMAGQEDAPTSEDERQKDYAHVPKERWFNNKPGYQRAFILFAGPLMNLGLGIFLYGVVAAMGPSVPETKVSSRIGMVVPDSPAAQAAMYEVSAGTLSIPEGAEPVSHGWQTGDIVRSVDGDKIKNILELAMAAALGGGSEHKIVIERTDPSGVVHHYISPVEPVKMAGSGHPRYGVAPFETALVRYAFANEPAAMHGIEAGDVIVRACGELTDRTTFSTLLADWPQGKPIDMEILRNGNTISLSLVPKQNGRFAGISFSPSLYPFIQLKEDEAPQFLYANKEFQARTNLIKGATLVEIDGVPANGAVMRSMEQRPLDDMVNLLVQPAGKDTETIEKRLSWGDVIQALTPFDETKQPVVEFITQAIEEATILNSQNADTDKEAGLRRRDVITEIDGKPATIALLREAREERLGETLLLTVARPRLAWGLIRKASTLEAQIVVDSVPAVGIAWDTKKVKNKIPASKVVPQAFRDGYHAFAMVGKTIQQLFAALIPGGSGGLSGKELGGPLLIGQFTAAAARQGFTWLLETMAFISINLCVFNLLPLPALDGGQLVLVGIEGVRRKPLSMKAQLWFQQVGIMFIIMLVIYVTFNDAKRMFFTWLP